MTRRTSTSSLGTLLLASLLFACTARVGAEGVTVPRDSAAICANHCSSIGMRLSAVAIMANNVGCVCQHRSHAASDSTSVANSSTAAAGMSTIMMQEAAAQDASRRSSQQLNTTYR